MGARIDFYTRDKLFLLLCSRRKLRSLGKIVASAERRRFSALFAEYHSGPLEALSCRPKYSSLVKAIQRALGGFPESLSAEERALFTSILTEHLDERIPASVLLWLVKSQVFRFGDCWLLKQVLFKFYPLALVEISDSRKGKRDDSQARATRASLACQRRAASHWRHRSASSHRARRARGRTEKSWDRSGRRFITCLARLSSSRPRASARPKGFWKAGVYRWFHVSFNEKLKTAITEGRLHPAHLSLAELRLREMPA
jgi:uncharacterized protein YbgA (DUF1722 family)